MATAALIHWHPGTTPHGTPYQNPRPPHHSHAAAVTTQHTSMCWPPQLLLPPSACCCPTVDACPRVLRCCYCCCCCGCCSSCFCGGCACCCCLLSCCSNTKSWLSQNTRCIREASAQQQPAKPQHRQVMSGVAVCPDKHMHSQTATADAHGLQLVTPHMLRPALAGWLAG